MYTLFAIGAFQTAVFSVLLFSKQKRRQADGFLASFFVVVTLYFLYMHSIQYNFWQKTPEVFILIACISLLFGPLLYFYLQSSIKEKIILKDELFHLTPIILVLGLLIPFLFYPKESKEMYFSHRFNELPWHVAVGAFLQYLSAPIYFIFILIQIRKYKERIQSHYSNVDTMNLSWMRRLIMGAVLILMADCFNVFVMNFTSLDVPVYFSWSIKLILLTFLVILGYVGIKQGNVFSPPVLINTSEEINAPIQKVSISAKTKTLPNEKVSLQIDTLKNFMSTNKPYLNPELRIHDLSSELNISVHVLSYLINTRLNQNFYDFINSYRIEEVKHRLHSEEFDSYTIVAIAFDCGFNSKATFNRLFKKYTQMTPSQYKSQKIK
jgi:AraC-like DNA-binding protein